MAMSDSCKISFVCLVMILFAGCNGPPETEPIWKKTKLEDLAPAKTDKTVKPKPAMISLTGYVFEIPADSLEDFANVWNVLRTEQITCENAEAFKSNAFVAGFGREEMAAAVQKILKLVKARNANTVSMLIFDGFSNDISVTEIGEKKIYYVAKSLKMESVTIGPGDILLRTIAERVPASKGVFQLRFVPVFSPALKTEYDEVKFSSASFRVNVSPGDFILIGPNKYSPHQITLGSLMFSTSLRKPMVRVFLFGCSRIDD